MHCVVPFDTTEESVVAGSGNESGDELEDDDHVQHPLGSSGD